MADRDPKEQLLDLGRNFVGARESCDLAALRECLDPGVVVYSNTSPWPTDREQLLSLVRNRHERLAEPRIEVLRIEALSDGFVLEEVLHGTYAGGLRIAAPTCVIATCEGGRITRLSQYNDSEAGTPLLDDRARVWRLASTVARSAGRPAFTAIDIVRSASALGLVTLPALEPSDVDVEQFGSGVDERAEARRADHARDRESNDAVTIPSPAPALPALDLAALAAHMTRPASRNGRAGGELADVIAALATNTPYTRQLADAGIDPRPLAEEWVALRDALPPDDPKTPVLGESELDRLAELGGPRPPEWDRSQRDQEVDEAVVEGAASEERIRSQDERWNALAVRVAAVEEGEPGTSAIDELREELRFEIAHWIERNGTNGRTVDEALEDAMQAAIAAARSYQPGDDYGYRTRASVAYVRAIKGRSRRRATTIHELNSVP